MTNQPKVALVTGASRGIGKAIAIQLATDGFHVVLNFAGNEEAAKQTKEAITLRAPQSEVLIHQADVSKADEVEGMFQTILETFGRLDVLVNNAGITRDNLMMRMKEHDWDAVIDTNLKSVFLCTQKATRTMMKQKSGSIINISSVVGLLGNAGQANYVAAKSGVIGLTKSNAKEFSAKGIRINAVAPGFIQTDMTDELSDDIKTALLKEIPLGKLGNPEDIAHMVSFLASDKSSYLTGQVISVDGGMHM